METTAHSSRPTNEHVGAASFWLERFLSFCVGVGALLAILASCYVASYSYQIDYGEGTLLEGALRVREAQPLYPVPSGLPVVIHVYGPVAYAVTSLTLPLHGVSFPRGRWLMLICALCICALMFTILRRWLSVPLALTFALVPLCLPAFRFWLYFIRADLVGILFSISAVTLYVRKPKFVIWTAPFFTAAVFSKYTLVAAPVAVLAHLILEKKFKQVLQFTMALAILFAATWWTLQLQTSGGYAFQTLSTHYDRYSLKQFFALMALVWLSSPVVTGLASFHVFNSLPRRVDFPSLYFLTASVTSLTAGKLGSTTNHFLEWMIAASICAGLGYASIKTEFLRRLPPVNVALGVSLLLAAVIQSRAALTIHPELTGCADAYRYVAAASPQVLSQSLGPLLWSEKSIVLTDPFAYGQLVTHGALSDASLVQAIDQRHFGLIVTTVDPDNIQPGDPNIWPQSLLKAMSRRYRVVKRFNCRDGSFMLEPRP